MEYSTSSPREKSFAFLAITIIIFAVYHGVYSNNYAFSDDYPFLSRVVFDNSINGYLKNNLFFTTFGRPITGFLIDIGFSLCGSIDNLKHLRIVTLVGFSLFSMSLFCVVREQKWSLPLALFFSISAVMLPSFQVYAAWTQYFPFPFALIIALYAGKIAWKENAESPSPKKMLISLLLVNISMMIHQSAAMIFWLFPIISILSGKVETFKHTWVKLFWCLSTVAVAALANKSLQKIPMLVFNGYRATDRGSLVADLQGKITWFINEPILNSLNLWIIDTRLWVGLAVFGIIVLGFLLTLLLDSHFRINRIAVVSLIVPLSYLPNLAISENWASYRTLSVLGIIVLLYLLFSLHIIWSKFSKLLNIPSKLQIVLSVIILASSIVFIGNSAFIKINKYFIQPQKNELAALREELSKVVVNQIKIISICQADWFNSPTKIVRYDEFGTPSLSVSFAPVPMTRLILNEYNYRWLDGIKVSSGKLNCKNCSADDGCYAIDSNRLLLGAKQTKI